jgi:hypothetical protein
MAENDHGEQFRDLIALMEEQRQSGQDANDIWWQNQEAREEGPGLPSGFFADAEAKVLYFRDEMREMRERIREAMYNIEDDIRETVDIETSEYKEYVRQREVEDRAFERSIAYMESQEYANAQGDIVEQRWMEHEDWLRSGGKEGEPHYQVLDGKQPEEALQAYQEEQQVANEAAQEQQREEATMQLQAFDGKTPEEQQQIYIQQVTQDAIRTGVEEGYPIRNHVGLEQQVAQAATPETVQAYTDALRNESMMSNSEERTSHARQIRDRLNARHAAHQSPVKTEYERDEGMSY